MSAQARMPAGLPPDVADHAKEFVGRNWALERICSWLSTGGGRLLAVTGKPGAGKTALAARLVQIVRGEVSVPAGAQIPTLHAAHFCRWRYIESIAPVEVLELISTQLANSIVGYADALASAGGRGAVQIILGRQSVGRVGKSASITMTQIGQVTIAEQDPRAVFDRLLRQPLRRLRDGGQLPDGAVVLIDGLDESAEGAPEPTLVRVLSAELSDPVPGLRLVLTTRPERVIPELGGLEIEQFDLTANQPAGVRDLEAYADYKLRTIPESARLSLTEHIAGASEGNFLYARHVIADLLASKSPAPSVADLRLPNSLADIYRSFLDREVGADRHVWSQRFRPLLGVLVQARGEGLSRDQLVAITGLPPSAVDDSLAVCAPYLTGDRAAGLRPFHQSLRDYLRAPGRHHIYPAEASWKIVVGLLPVRGNVPRWDLAGDYLLRHGPEFAADAGQADQVLSDPEFLVHADPVALKPLLKQARDDTAILAAAVYSSSSTWHTHLEPEARRRALAIDAAAFGARDLAARLAQPLPWLPIRMLGVSVMRFSRREDMALGYRMLKAQRIVELGNQQVLLVHEPDAGLQMWELDTGRPVGETFARNVTAVAATQLGDRAVAVTGDYTGSLTVWDLATRRPLKPPPLKQPLAADGMVTAVSCIDTGGLTIAVSLHESFLLRSDYWTLRIWDLSDGRETCDPIPLGDEPVRALACTHLGGRAVAVTGSHDGTLRTWDLAAGRETCDPIPLGDKPVRALACTHLSGRAVAVAGSDDGALRICDLATRRQAGAPLESRPITVYFETTQEPLAAGPVYHVICTQLDGQPVAVSGTHDGMVRVWHLATGELLDTIPFWTRGIAGIAAADSIGYLAAGAGLGVTVLTWKPQ